MSHSNDGHLSITVTTYTFSAKSTWSFRVHLEWINTACWRYFPTEKSLCRNFFTLKNAETSHFTIHYSNLCCNYIITFWPILYLIYYGILFLVLNFNRWKLFQVAIKSDEPQSSTSESEEIDLNLIHLMRLPFHWGLFEIGYFQTFQFQTKFIMADARFFYCRF